MILTEEQRVAIELAMKYIARWPFAYKELHARGVLQAMIDSSEHFTDATKMIGFDLERARGLRDFLQDDCAEVGDVWAEMIAEIERLRAIIDTPTEENGWLSDLEALDSGTRSGMIDIEIAKKWHAAYRKSQNSNLLRKREIERLRGEMENYGDDYVCQMKSKDARIQELEDALVEMVATNPCNIPTLCDVVHDELMCLALDGNCDFWKGCPQKNELRKAARKQLQAEGKIGPDDSKKISHLRPYEVVAADLAGMLAKSWQVTDERKAAILHCKRMLTFLKEDDAPCYDVEKITKDESVLVAMLEEAKP